MTGQTKPLQSEVERPSAVQAKAAISQDTGPPLSGRPILRRLRELRAAPGSPTALAGGPFCQPNKWWLDEGMGRRLPLREPGSAEEAQTPQEAGNGLCAARWRISFTRHFKGAGGRTRAGQPLRQDEQWRAPRAWGSAAPVAPDRLEI